MECRIGPALEHCEQEQEETAEHILDIHAVHTVTTEWHSLYTSPLSVIFLLSHFGNENIFSYSCNLVNIGYCLKKHFLNSLWYSK